VLCCNLNALYDRSDRSRNIQDRRRDIQMNEATSLEDNRTRSSGRCLSLMRRIGEKFCCLVFYGGCDRFSALSQSAS
jgi:hypothetical protein